MSDADSPSTTTDPAAELSALASTVDDEVMRWEDRGVYGPASSGPGTYPDPHETNGLPPGWRIKVRYADFALGADLVLVRRDEGGWVLVRHARGTANSRVLLVHPTLVGLYDIAVKRFERDPAFYGEIAHWVHRVLMSLFDAADPTEAAERVLVAMGAPIRIPPGAAC